MFATISIFKYLYPNLANYTLLPFTIILASMVISFAFTIVKHGHTLLKGNDISYGITYFNNNSVCKKGYIANWFYFLMSS